MKILTYIKRIVIGTLCFFVMQFILKLFALVGVEIPEFTKGSICSIALYIGLNLIDKPAEVINQEVK